jgi:hypothetical protein
MNNMFAVRTFLALFVSIFGLGLIFAHENDGRIMLGAFIAAIGLTFLRLEVWKR